VPLEDRVIDATLRCVARWGIAKTTLDDVAREAGCGRASIYRAFRGGKQEVLTATLQHELVAAVAAIDAAVRDLDSLEDVLVAGTITAARLVNDHAALGFMLANEPIAFERMGRVFDAAAACAEPHLARFIPVDDVPRAAEWVSRVVLTYAFNPPRTVDLRNEDDARELVRTFFLPALSPQTAMSRSAR
jgi:AcrR family transcriptional regulator